MMKQMFESGSDGKAAAGMFGEMPFPFPGQPPEKDAVPDAEQLLQQLQAMMGGPTPATGPLCTFYKASACYLALNIWNGYSSWRNLHK